MSKAHDRGGWPDTAPIDRSEHELAGREKKTDALGGLLSDAGKGVFTVDERRLASLEHRRHARPRHPRASPLLARLGAGIRDALDPRLKA